MKFDWRDADTPHAEIADELRRIESGLGSSKSPSIGEAGDVVSGADDDSACATDDDATAAAAAATSGDDPVVAGELDCEFGGGGASDWRE